MHDNTYQSSSGKKVVITEVGLSFLVDSHMHIESNNCAPLVLQWNLLPLWKRKPVSRQDMNNTAASWLARMFIGRLGQIGRLSTDMIADLFFGQLKNKHMRQEMLWLKCNEKQMQEIEMSPNKKQKLEDVGEDLGLSDLSDKTTKNFKKNFEENCHYYYKNKKLFRISFAKQMDMSYSHYWGKTGLPLYIGGAKTNYYINNFINIKVREQKGVCNTHNCDSKHCFVTIDNETTHLRDNSKSNSTIKYFHLSADFDFKGHYMNPDVLHKSIAFEGDTTFIESQLEKRRIHIIQKAPEEDDKTFEDFERQCALTKIALVKHSIKLFAFYHYDPRRYYTDQAELTKKIENLSRNHSFFTYTIKKSHYGDNCLVNRQKYSRDLVVLKPHQRINTKEYLETLLKARMYSNEDVYKELLSHPNATDEALFWGIKMYPRLGYKPEDYTTYPHLTDLYENCCKGIKIPLTTHCSFGGMKFADTYNHQKFDYNIQHEKYDIDESLNFVTYNYASPDNWGRVLQRFNDLKINLAHFGGCIKGFAKDR